MGTMEAVTNFLAACNGDRDNAMSLLATEESEFIKVNALLQMTVNAMYQYSRPYVDRKRLYLIATMYGDSELEPIPQQLISRWKVWLDYVDESEREFKGVYKHQLIKSLKDIQTFANEEIQRMEKFENKLQEIVECIATKLWGLLNVGVTGTEAEQRLETLQKLNNSLCCNFFIGQEEEDPNVYFFVEPRFSLDGATDNGLQTIDFDAEVLRLCYEHTVHGLHSIFVETARVVKSKRWNRLTLLRRNPSLNWEKNQQIGRMGVHNIQDSMGQSSSGVHLETSPLLLGLGANIEHQNNHGDPLLVFAARSGHLEMAKFFLDHGANIEDENNNGDTPLISAASNGQLEMAKFLLNRRANIEHQNSNGDTPLSSAASNGHLEIDRLFLDRYANRAHQDNNEDTPLSSAAGYGNLLMSQQFLDRYAIMERRYNNPGAQRSRALHHLRRSANRAHRNNNEDTPLIFPASNGHLETAPPLLDQVVNIEHQNNNGDTPLISAASNGHLEVAKFLLNRRANIEHQNNNGDTSLASAASNGHLEMVRLLLDRGANFQQQNNHGHTPLTLASLNGHLETSRLLLDRGANIDHQYIK